MKHHSISLDTSEVTGHLHSEHSGVDLRTPYHEVREVDVCARCAVNKFLVKINEYLTTQGADRNADFEGKVLYWRVKPELDWFYDMTKGEGLWGCYARLLVVNG